MKTNPQKSKNNKKNVESKPAMASKQAGTTPKDWKLDWDFKPVYKGINDPKIDADVKAIEVAYEAFAKKYGDEKAGKPKDFISDAKALKQSLDDWNALLGKTANWIPAWYLHLIECIDSTNTKAKAKYNLIVNQLTKAANKIIFYNLKLAKITVENQKKFLADSTLKTYHEYLKQIFEQAKYNLSESEEKILNLKQQPAHDMWESAQKKFFNSQKITLDGKEMTLTEASLIKPDLPIKKRRALHALLTAKYKEISFFAEAELNAIVQNKITTDELRGYKTPYEATVLGYQNSIKSVEALVETVTKHFKDSNEFFKIKAKVLGLPKLTMAELGTSMSKSRRKYTLEEGVMMVKDAFGAIKPELAETFMNFIKNGQIDFLPKAGKRNGAFCSSVLGAPTYIMLNHIDNASSISTLAHEMGHAFHSEYSKHQIPLYADYTISIAEVASTFFENVLFDYLYARASKEEQKTMLLEKIQDDIFTTHAQIAYFNFENDLHTSIKAKGSLSAKEIAELLCKNRKKMFGPAFEYTDNDWYTFISVPHFRYFFYVYAYAYGQLIANALYAEFKKDPAFFAKVEQFLAAGGTKKPDDVFKDIGIDVTKPEFFEKGLQEIAAKIKEVKKLVG